MTDKMLYKVQRLVKWFLPFYLFAFLPLSVSATDPQKFSPEKFQADMEQFITQEASLTPEEAAKFFPLLREMLAKQRAVHGKIKKECGVKPADEAECKKVVQKRDVYELKLRTIQQTYHNKFFAVLPASKVYDVIRANDRFHRQAFRNWSKDHQLHPVKK